MAEYFKDRVSGALHGQNRRFYRAIAPDGTVRMDDFRLDLRNSITQEGDPVSAGNLNFASGNAELPVAAGQNIRRGQLVTLTPAGASVANITRPLAFTGTQRGLTTALKLTNSKIILVYQHAALPTVSGYVVVADIDWASRTLVMGTALSLNNVTMIEVVNATSFCSVHGRELTLCTVNGRTITRHPVVVISAHTGVTNPVRASGDSVLVVNRAASAWEAREWRISGASFVLAGTRATFDLAADARWLYAVNGLPGRFLLYRRVNASNGHWSVNTLGFPTATRVELGSTPVANQITLPRTHGSSGWLTANNEHVFCNDWNWTIGRVDVRFLRINRTTGALSVGAAHRLPNVYDMPAFTVDSAGRPALIGPALRGGLVDVAMFELSPEQPALTEAQPFRNTRLSTGTLNALGRPERGHFGLAVENDANPGEYLFMQHYRRAESADWQPVQFSFGCKGDSANSRSIAGVALEDAAGGRVRVQASGKHLAGMWNGLRRGGVYGAGANGGLVAQWTGGAATVGVAASATDLIFYGAKAWG